MTISYYFFVTYHASQKGIFSTSIQKLIIGNIKNFWWT